MKQAEQVVAKLAPVVETHQALFKKPDLAMVPAVLTEPIQKALEQFCQWVASAQDVIHNGRQCVLPELKEVTSAIGHAAKQRAMIQSTLATIARSMGK